MTKELIRAQIKKLQRSNKRMSIDFQSITLFENAKFIGTYMPLPNEIDTIPLFKNSEKTFFIPAFEKKTKTYRMARYTSNLQKGKFGILEPKDPVWAERDELDLILTPGIAFDKKGNRLGRGGGFYDRLLPQYKAIRAGICFDFQLLEKIPSEPHDCKMDFIITPSHVFKCQLN